MTEDPSAFFREYVKGKKTIVCDPSATSRSAVFKAFMELGADVNSVSLVSNFQQAEQEIERLSPRS
jgi:hypothetical protein